MVGAAARQRFEGARSAISVAERLTAPHERVDGEAVKRPRQLGLVAGFGDDGTQLGMLELIAKPELLGVDVDGDVGRAELGEGDDGIDVVGWFGSITATRSPRPMPRPERLLARRLLAESSAPNVMTESSKTQKGRSRSSRPRRSTRSRIEAGLTPRT
jgi:hypothetical protein